MALTGRVLASIYRKGNNNLATGAMGRLHSFPSAKTIIRPADLGTVADTVTMNSVITLLPEGLNQGNKDYYTDATVAQLGTNGS